MASLRNIMNNVDDDPQPFRPQGGSTPKPPHHSAPLPGSGYAPGPDLSIHHQPSSSNYSRGASPHSTYSHTSESSGSRHHHPHAAAPQARRDSTGHEHTGYSYSHGQQYGASHDMRPMMQANTMGEPAVKLTPVTGRVSRAKKGMPVHICEMCHPPKTFTRAEHLRRHQLSHQPPELACGIAGCNKVFHRKDLLDRHQQRHELDDRQAVPGQPRRNSPPRRHSQSYGSSSPSPGTQHGSYGASSNTMSSTPRHEASGPGLWASSNRPFGHPLPAPRISASPQQYYSHSPQGRYSADSTPVSHADSPENDTKMQDADAPGIKAPEAGQDFYMSDDQSNSASKYSSSGSTYSTPSDSSRDGSKRTDSSSGGLSAAAAQFGSSPEIQGAFSFSRNNMVNPSYGFPVTAVSMPRQSMPVSLPIPAYDDESMASGKSLLANSAIRALPTPFAAGRSSDLLMAVPPPMFAGPMVPPQLSISPPPLGLCENFATSMPIMAPSQSVREAVPIYLEVYWNKVHPMYPIIHRPTFEKALESVSEATDVLQCAMAAVATQFLGHEDHRINGSQLQFHAACKLKVASDADDWPLEIMQAALLSEYYMRFRGRDKDAYQTSELFRLLYQKAFHKVTARTNSTEPGRPSAWTEWVEDEAQRRILASCFLLDIHCMRYFERAPVSVDGLNYADPASLCIPLSANTTKPWEAYTLDAWSKLKPQCPRISVGQAISQAYKPTDIEESSPFDASVLLAAYSLQFPSRQNPTRLDLIQDASAIDLSQISVLSMFGYSAVANTYLALHFAPLHVVLSVSGDSWVFNKKVLRLPAFTQHQHQLARWRDSGSSAAAAAFAARALVAFLGLGGGASDTSTSASTDISDFWGIYVCALICWSFGHTGRESTGSWKDGSSRPAALQWLRSAAKMQPAQVQRLSGRRNAQAVVGLAREALEREHFGGRSILIADAVGVLRKLEDGDGCKRF